MFKFVAIFYELSQNFTIVLHSFQPPHVFLASVGTKIFYKKSTVALKNLVSLAMLLKI
jgi:hypothetical protein